MTYENEKLGLGDPPVPVYLFVALEKDETGPYCWYTRNHDANVNTPVRERALTGYLREITMSLQEYKGEKLIKMNLKIQADRTYIVRTGVTTTFARGLVLALGQIEDFSAPICIATQPGDEIVLGSVYQAGTRIHAEWDENAKLFPLILRLQERLGQTPQTLQQMEAELSAKKNR